MSGGRMSGCPAGFTSTPIKTSLGTDVHASKDLDDGVLSDDEDTFSLLSPIYHDSFDSDEEELESVPAQHASPRLSMSPVRCELPRTPSEQMWSPAVQLSAWQVWLVNKTKQESLKLQNKAEEERLLKERKEQQEREREQKKIIVDEKVQDWLKMKREQERHEQTLKHSKEEKEMQRQQEKQREAERKAQHKFKDWLQKKDQEKAEKEKREKEEAALKEEQEKQRHRRAEDKFKEWLEKTDEKSRKSPRSPCSTTSLYNRSYRSYPSPSFYNPIPWKPIHVPRPEASLNKNPQNQRKIQPSPGAAFRPRKTVNTTHSLPRR